MSSAVLSRDRRSRAPRVKVAGSVRLQLAAFEELLVAEAIDVSETGMFIAGDEVTLASVGEIVGVHFEVDEELAIETVARVARVIPPGGRYASGIGVEFVRMQHDMEERLGRFVDGRLARS
ncbi:MAG TPA: PilZ domain-containing protein [Myxococcales bacterium]|jgi:c-di-GMP-binding flagellar brake protein YcgR|nr:PilZ domain-containing protein [Myxococcales bacterium]